MSRAEPEDIRTGAYLSDGRRLWEVLRTWLPNGQVMLEDAGAPEMPAVVLSVSELVGQGMTVVRPAR